MELLAVINTIITKSVDIVILLIAYIRFGLLFRKTTRFLIYLNYQITIYLLKHIEPFFECV